MEFRNLKAQYSHLKNEIDPAILDACAGAHYIAGPEVASLEKSLADYAGVGHCVACANGTDALQLALMAWGVGPGDAVFVPDFTFFSSGEVVSALGATPVFVDVDERSYNIDPTSLEQAIGFVRTQTELSPKVVVAVDLFGLPADYPVIQTICKKNNLFLLEDGAQGFGGSIDGKMACSFGDISTTSFFPAKPLGCYGDGGAVFTDNADWAALVRSFAVHGKGTMKYDNVRIGMNSRLDTIQAAILQVKLKAFAEYEVNDVNDIAAVYDEALKDTGLVLPKIEPGFRSSWAQYTVQVPDRIDRQDLQDKLKSQGIPTMVYYPKPMHAQKAFEGASLCPDGCPITEKLCAHVLSLPMGPYLVPDEAIEVAEAIAREL